MKRKLHKQEMIDIVKGATFLGAGGGGSPKVALPIVEQIREATLLKPEDISDNSNVVVMAGVGSPVVSVNVGYRGELITALEIFEEVVGKRIDYIVPFETGGANFSKPIHAGAAKGLPIVDGDGAGRAVPELQMTMFSIQGIPIAPLSLADSKGNSAILYPVDAYIAEKLARAVTTVFGGIAGLVCQIMTGKQLKDTAIPDTLSTAERVGKAIREAKECMRDPVGAVIEAIGGTVLAKGKIAKKTEEVKAGFDYGRVFLEDIIVDYKNENMIAWRDSKPIIMAPDSICWLTTDGEPLTNADVKEGLEVAAIGKRAHEKWKTPEGSKLFGHILESIGYKGGYIAFEEWE